MNADNKIKLVKIFKKANPKNEVHNKISFSKRLCKQFEPCKMHNFVGSVQHVLRKNFKKKSFQWSEISISDKMEDHFKAENLFRYGAPNCPQLQAYRLSQRRKKLKHIRRELKQSFSDLTITSTDYSECIIETKILVDQPDPAPLNFESSLSENSCFCHNRRPINSRDIKRSDLKNYPKYPHKEKKNRYPDPKTRNPIENRLSGVKPRIQRSISENSLIPKYQYRISKENRNLKNIYSPPLNPRRIDHMNVDNKLEICPYLSFERSLSENSLLPKYLNKTHLQNDDTFRNDLPNLPKGLVLICPNCASLVQKNCKKFNLPFSCSSQSSIKLLNGKGTPSGSEDSRKKYREKSHKKHCNSATCPHVDSRKICRHLDAISRYQHEKMYYPSNNALSENNSNEMNDNRGAAANPFYPDPCFIRSFSEDSMNINCSNYSHIRKRNYLYEDIKYPNVHLYDNDPNNDIDQSFSIPKNQRQECPPKYPYRTFPMNKKSVQHEKFQNVPNPLPNQHEHSPNCIKYSTPKYKSPLSEDSYFRNELLPNNCENFQRKDFSSNFRQHSQLRETFKNEPNQRNNIKLTNNLNKQFNTPDNFENYVRNDEIQTYGPKSFLSNNKKLSQKDRKRIQKRKSKRNNATIPRDSLEIYKKKINKGLPRPAENYTTNKNILERPFLSKHADKCVSTEHEIFSTGTCASNVCGPHCCIRKCQKKSANILSRPVRNLSSKERIDDEIGQRNFALSSNIGKCACSSVYNKNENTIRTVGKQLEYMSDDVISQHNIHVVHSEQNLNDHKINLGYAKGHNSSRLENRLLKSIGTDTFERVVKKSSTSNKMSEIVNGRIKFKRKRLFSCTNKSLKVNVKKSVINSNEINRLSKKTEEIKPCFCKDNPPSDPSESNLQNKPYRSCICPDNAIDCDQNGNDRIYAHGCTCREKLLLQSNCSVCGLIKRSIDCGKNINNDRIYVRNKVESNCECENVNYRANALDGIESECECDNENNRLPVRDEIISDRKCAYLEEETSRCKCDQNRNLNEELNSYLEVTDLLEDTSILKDMKELFKIMASRWLEQMKAKMKRIYNEVKCPRSWKIFCNTLQEPDSFDHCVKNNRMPSKTNGGRKRRHRSNTCKCCKPPELRIY